MGNMDKAIRIIIAIILGVLFFSGVISGVLGNVLMVFAVVFLLTSVVGFCPLYTIFGINTCSSKSKQ